MKFTLANRFVSALVKASVLTFCKLFAGRAEALLIAAYGNGIRMKSRVTQLGACDPGLDLELPNPSDPPSANTAEANLVLECAESTGAARV